MLRPFGSTFLFALLALVGCGDPNAGAVFADLQYAVRCVDDVSACEGFTDYDICGFNQGDPCTEPDVRPQAIVSCDTTETETTRTITFSAQQGEASIRVSGLTVAKGGGSSMGGACTVTVTDGPNTFSGACGGSPPSEGQPCQITNVEFIDDSGNPTFRGNVFCELLPNTANPTLHVEVTEIGAGPGPAGRPGRFRIANCAGLTCTPDTCSMTE